MTPLTTNAPTVTKKKTQKNTRILERERKKSNMPRSLGKFTVEMSDGVEDRRRLILSVADALLNYVLFGQLTLFFWYGTGELHSLVITGGTSGVEKVHRAVLGLVASSGVEILAATFDHELNSAGKEVLRDAGYAAFYIFTRLYNYVMGVANILFFTSVQVLYEEYVGPEGLQSLTGHAGWAVGVLAVICSLRFARGQISSPFFVCLDSSTEKDWFTFSFYFERSLRRFPDRLLNAVFTVVVVSSILDLYWVALDYAFCVAIYPTSLVKSIVVSCVIAYVIIAVLKLSTKAAADMSIEFEVTGRHGMKLLVEDVYIFGANFSVILLWKGLYSNGQLVSQAVGPLLKVAPSTVAVVNQIIAFLVMSLLDVSCLLVNKGPSIDGSLTEGNGVIFSTQYLNIAKSEDHDQYYDHDHDDDDDDDDDYHDDDDRHHDHPDNPRYSRHHSRGHAHRRHRSHSQDHDQRRQSRDPNRRRHSPDHDQRRQSRDHNGRHHSHDHDQRRRDRDRDHHHSD